MSWKRSERVDRVGFGEGRGDGLRVVKEERKRVLVSVDPKLLSRASIPHWSPHLGSFFLYLVTLCIPYCTVHRLRG